MAEIILDDDLRARLNGLESIVKVRDPSGEMVGLFLPNGMYESLFKAWARSEVPEAELDAASESYRKNGGIDGSEAVAYMLKRAGTVPR
jgi:hypothetical protein